MKSRAITERVSWMGAVDWDRRLFDALIPLPDGTSYNAYLIRGSEKTVLVDTVDPRMKERLFAQLEDVCHLDYVIAQHAEQDHSGTLPQILERYPEAPVLTTPKGKDMLANFLRLPEERIQSVADGETLSLGDCTLEFIYTPWVHWPETMTTYLHEERILFTCDFFGSHLATSDLYVTDEAQVEEAAKRYYAEIMMPFRKIIDRNLDRLAEYAFDYIAPSHGPIYQNPDFILKAYRSWVSAPPSNKVVLPYVSMHGSTFVMVTYFVEALVERGVKVQQFELTDTDLGKLAMALVDAGTIVLGSPTVLGGAHPQAAYAASLAAALRPKAQFATVIGSYGWKGGAVKTIATLIDPLRVEILDPVTCAGLPKEGDFAALDALADTIARKHQEAEFLSTGD
ncbi:MAG: FprA family A-type flavoprotein [Anaerolineae bacterium]